jgi:CubicO group peptidase (beta-lactamase class C family)
MSQEWKSSFSKFASQLIEKYQIPGVGIGLSIEGKTIYQEGFGYRDKESGLKVTEETVFGLGSITKSFTCVAIMQLQESGKVSVQDPVQKYLPEFQIKDQAKGKEITIHHLMTNSSGLPPLPSRFYAMKRSMDADPSLEDYKGVKKDTGNQPPIDSYEELMEFISKLDFELLGAPGDEFSYSNDGFSLLGAIVERVSGQNYETYIKDNILRPLGMNNSAFFIDELLEHHTNVTTLYAAKEHAEETIVYPAPLWWDSPAMRPAGFLKSTVEDMLKYTQMFCNGGFGEDTRILTSNSINQMMQPYIECEPGKFYGYGLMITEDFFGNRLVEHGGNLKGIAAQICMVPEKGISGVTLTNLTATPIPRIMFSALNSLLGYPPEASHHNYDTYIVPFEQLKEYEGIYKSNEGMQVALTVADNTLVFTAQGIVYPIRAIDKDLFIVTIRDQEEILRITREKNGEVSGVVHHYRRLAKVYSDVQINN